MSQNQSASFNEQPSNKVLSTRQKMDSYEKIETSQNEETKMERSKKREEESRRKNQAHNAEYPLPPQNLKEKKPQFITLDDDDESNEIVKKVLETLSEMSDKPTSNFFDVSASSPEAPSTSTGQLMAQDGKFIEAKCDICEKSATSITRLLNHRQQNHGNDAMMTCPACQQKFEGRMEIHNHMNFELGIDSCWKCGQCLPNEQALASHEESCYGPGDEKEIRCPSCPTMLFEKVDQLLEHRLQHSRDTMFECPKCADEFATRTLIKRHLNVEYGIYPCQKCGRSLESKWKLEKHKEDCGNTAYSFQEMGMGSQAASSISYLNKYDDTECHDCCPEWSRLTVLELLEHRHRHHQIGRKELLKCHLCDITFATFRDIHRHLSIKFKRFACLYCETQYDDEEAMDRCAKDCENRRLGQPLKCPHGDYEASSVNDIIVHYLQNHGSKFCCWICNKTYTSKSAFIQHMKMKEFKVLNCFRCKDVVNTKTKLIEHEVYCAKPRFIERRELSPPPPPPRYQPNGFQRREDRDFAMNVMAPDDVYGRGNRFGFGAPNNLPDFADLRDFVNQNDDDSYPE